MYEQLNGAQDSKGNDVVGATEDDDVPPSTIDNVKDFIKQNNKSAEKDGIGAELITMGPCKLDNCLHQLIAKIWNTELLPEEYKDGAICSIWNARTVVQSRS